MPSMMDEEQKAFAYDLVRTFERLRNDKGALIHAVYMLIEQRDLRRTTSAPPKADE